SLASKRFADVGPPWLEARQTVGENGLVGQNAAPLLTWENNTQRYVRTGVKLTRTGKNHPLASTQDHHTLSVPAHLAPPGLERRPIIQETTLSALTAGATALAAVAQTPAGQHQDLWPDDHPFPERRWGIVIDL